MVKPWVFFLFLFIICDCSYLACYVCICYIGGKTLKAMTCWDKVLLMPFWWHSMRKRLWMHLRFTLIMLSSPRYFHLLLRRLWWWIFHLLLSKHQHELEDIQAIKVFMFEEYAYHICVCESSIFSLLLLVFKKFELEMIFYFTINGMF